MLKLLRRPFHKKNLQTLPSLPSRKPKHRVKVKELTKEGNLQLDVNTSVLSSSSRPMYDNIESIHSLIELKALSTEEQLDTLPVTTSNRIIKARHFDY